MPFAGGSPSSVTGKIARVLDPQTQAQGIPAAVRISPSQRMGGKPMPPATSKARQSAGGGAKPRPSGPITSTRSPERRPASHAVPGPTMRNSRSISQPSEKRRSPPRLNGRRSNGGSGTSAEPSDRGHASNARVRRPASSSPGADRQSTCTNCPGVASGKPRTCKAISACSSQTTRRRTTRDENIPGWFTEDGIGAT